MRLACIGEPFFQPQPDINVSQVKAAICFFVDGGGNSLRVVEPTLRDGTDISGCTITDREPIQFKIVELMLHLDMFECDNHFVHKLLLRSCFHTFQEDLEPLICYGTDEPLFYGDPLISVTSQISQPLGKLPPTTHASLPFQPFTNFTEPTNQTLFEWMIGRDRKSVV